MNRFLHIVIVFTCSLIAVAEDNILFSEDFEWMATETNIKTYVSSSGINVSDNVGEQIYRGSYNPYCTVIKSTDGLSVWDFLMKKGYNVYSSDENQAKKCLSCAQNYLKISVLNYTGALVLPSMPAAGDGIENVRLTFDWTPMTDGGNAIWDKTLIVVEVMNGTNLKSFPIESANKIDGFTQSDRGKIAIDPYRWHRVDIPLEGCTINKDTRIILRNADPDFPKTKIVNDKKRWFLDNIKVYTGNGDSSVDEVNSNGNSPIEYFNLQGLKINNPKKGMFIQRQGSKITKIIL